MWRRTRITILLIILATVAFQAWREQEVLEWRQSLKVAIYPVNADQSHSVDIYLASLNRRHFADLETYFSEQAMNYGLGIDRPLVLYIGNQVKKIPPALPEANGILNVIFWSLKFRFYAWFNSPDLGIRPDIRMYVLYHDPKNHKVLSHSSALSKGRIGRVNLYGDDHYNQQNLVILAHELLHTLNASDKYHLSTNQPLYPHGYAEPYREPLLPQATAELMAGRIPRTAQRADIPKNLNETSIGAITAREIKWLK